MYGTPLISQSWDVCVNQKVRHTTSTSTNPDPSIMAYVVGELTVDKITTYDEVLLSGMGIGHSSFSLKHPPSASAGSAVDIKRVEQELKDSTKSPGPLDLRISLESVEPDSPTSTLPLDLTLTTVSEKQLSLDNPKPDTVKLEEIAKLDIPLTPSPPLKTVIDKKLELSKQPKLPKKDI